jgi:hypothetical protein
MTSKELAAPGEKTPNRIPVSMALVKLEQEFHAPPPLAIAPEDQAAVFEEFRQVGGPQAQKREGTGLGLALAKRFVELHGGSIRVQSALGQGAPNPVITTLKYFEDEYIAHIRDKVCPAGVCKINGGRRLRHLHRSSLSARLLR